MRIQDIDRSLQYAYASHAGGRRTRCSILVIGVPLPYYQFKGVEIELHHKSPEWDTEIRDTEIKRVPARNIVCTWDEHEIEQRRKQDEMVQERAQHKPYIDAALALQQAFQEYKIEARVRCAQNSVLVDFQRADQVQALAAHLREAPFELIVIRE